MTHATLNIPKEKMADFCRKWKVIECSLFGSVLREDFGPESDVDVLVTFAPDARWGLFDLVHMEDELAALLGRPVDVVERRSVEQSENYVRRRHILTSAEPIYAEGSLG